MKHIKSESTTGTPAPESLSTAPLLKAWREWEQDHHIIVPRPRIIEFSIEIDGAVVKGTAESGEQLCDALRHLLRLWSKF